MSLKEELFLPLFKQESAVTIGVFDGVHLGHLSLLKKLISVSKKKHLTSVVLTFWPHPREVLSPDTKVSLLTMPAYKEALLKEAGVDTVLSLPFNRKLAALDATYFTSLLVDRLKMRVLVIGPDFSMGKDRGGSASLLHSLGEKLGFSLLTLPSLTLSDEEVSSTAIRKALAIGEMLKVSRSMGRYYRLCGHIVAGDNRGASLGFPTANLSINPKQALPTDGVYAARAILEGKPFAALVNIGSRPTFGDGKHTTEVFLLNYSGNIYGKELEVDIIEYLRREIRFDSASELKMQIALDLLDGKAILAKEGII